ncbi:MAG TPA: cytochrome c biogenesis protein ResB [Mycobacteriales bacterium]|nr:cytochrome c biogenesis protein ResB [Mycobacteriales bacterium]
MLSFQLRRLWGQLISMRTALVLLFLLALAAVPGASFPQRDLNDGKVEKYYHDHPTLAPVLNRLWGFEVFTSPWFSAIYLLLFISLTGCLISRMRVHLPPLIMGPPQVPAHLSKLPLHERVETEREPSQVADELQSSLREMRWRRMRRRTDPDGTITLSTERGQLREVGNLIFHFALVVVLVGVALGSLWGWKGGALIVENSQFCNSVQSYDQFTPGRLVSDKSITPFCLTMKNFQARYLSDGQPVNYKADLRYDEGKSAGSSDPRKPYTLQVNHPLRLHGAGVFLINHGFAPILRFTDRYGTTFESPTPFLPRDPKETSEGVVALPDANQDPESDKKQPNVQVAFEGIYVPTAPQFPPFINSEYPTRENEGITLLAYRGDTGLDSGIPRSVYTLDQSKVRSGQLALLGSKFLQPGQSWQLDDGSSVTFVGTKQWMSVEISRDPGRLTALVGAAAMVAGLLISLFIRRRRLFVRLHARGDGTSIELAGLTRADSEAFAAEFRRIVSTVREKTSVTESGEPSGAQTLETVGTTHAD